MLTKLPSLAITRRQRERKKKDDLSGASLVKWHASVKTTGNSRLLPHCTSSSSTHNHSISASQRRRLSAADFETHLHTSWQRHACVTKDGTVEQTINHIQFCTPLHKSRTSSSRILRMILCLQHMCVPCRFSIQRSSVLAICTRPCSSPTSNPKTKSL
jgi:hypothetical protein